jgi:tetratricopeptide (TPR) repeat protein
VPTLSVISCQLSVYFLTFEAKTLTGSVIQNPTAFLMKQGVIQEKPVEFLINSIKQKLHGTDVPKHCWLIGAGCSVRSGIPTGENLIDLLKMEIFKRDYIADAVDFDITPPFDYPKYKEGFNTFIKEKNLLEAFKKFAADHEAEARKEVDRFDAKNISYLMPPNQRSKQKDEQASTEENKAIFEAIKQDIYKDYEYGYFFRQYSPSARERQILIEKVIENKPTKYGYVCLANLIYNNHARTVFTTNFDDLLNEALLGYFFKHAKVLAHSELSNYIDYRGKTPHIIKLHGDYMFSNVRNTSDEINNLTNKLTDKLFDALNEGFGLVVLGYNGADYSIINKLEEAKERTGDSPYPLIWCGRKEPHQLHWRVQHLLKETRNSYYVKIDGFDALMARLETKLGLAKLNLEQKTKSIMEDLHKFYNEALKEAEIKGEVKVNLEKKRDFHKVFNDAYIEKDPIKKMELYKEASLISPTEPEPYYNRGYEWQNMWKTSNDEANLLASIEEFKKAIDADPLYELPYQGWAWSLQQQWTLHNDEKYLREAIEKNKKAVDLNPYDALPYYNWGWCIQELWKIYKEDSYLLDSIEKYKKSIELNPYGHLAYLGWAWVLQQLWTVRREERYVLEAIEKNKKAVEINTTDDVGYYNWGWCLQQLWNLHHKEGYLNDAIDKFKLAIDRNPLSDAAFYNWGWTLQRLWEANGKEQHLVDSIDILKGALKLKPESDFYLGGLAWTMLKLWEVRRKEEDLKAAIDLFEKAIAINPKLEMAHFNLKIIRELPEFKQIMNQSLN